MAAPSSSVRQTPAGNRMPEGFRTLITFNLVKNVALFEVSAKPPGVDGGDAIDITTQHNLLVHTMFPRTLIKWDDLTFNAAYDPDALSKILNHLINKNGSITQLFPDGSTLDFFGFLRKFEPQELKEGEFPMAQVTVTVSNYDDTNHVESTPVLTPHAGT